MRPVIVQDDDDFSRPPPPPPSSGSHRRGGLGFIIIIIFALLLGGRSIASFFIELQWWRELGQADTWISMLSYSIIPVVVAIPVIFAILWISHLRGVKHGGGNLRFYPAYRRISTAILLGASILLSLTLVDSWTIMRFVGAAGSSTEDVWRDPVFNLSLNFYFFNLPAYRMLLAAIIGIVIVSMLIYWVAARGWALRERFQDLRQGGQDIDISELRLHELLESKMIRIAAAIGLVTLAIRTYLDRYDFLMQEHGFMTGMDYVAQNIALPLIWLSIAAILSSAVLVLLRKGQWAMLLVAVSIFVPTLASRLVNWLHVRPNEISIQRPYIERHIAGTRAAFGLDKRTKEVDFAAKIDGGFDPQQHRAILDNVRLWDWKAFHDATTQIQALRPYYAFADADVDRYMIPDANGTPRIRQVLLTPRELDVRQLPEARTSWVNPHFIYTHGYGAVMAEANRITSDGLPHLFIQNAPPEIRTPGLKLTRPEIYYGEVVHEPVFVRTEQAEFNYPSGTENVSSHYEGTGGFPVSSFLTRFAAVLREGDWNILLTSYLKENSRMMIRRNVNERLRTISPFLVWDRDPYLVVTDEGRLVWIVDGYTSSASHPFSRRVRTDQFGTINYIRNAVKATIDAYDGTVNIYTFQTDDPIIKVYNKLFPNLFKASSEMPADLRQHARYPETIFRVQAEMYRTYHMRDPEAFYNKEDMWDIAKNTSSSGETPTAEPTYLVASLPDSDEPEFLLMVPFTPRNKDNLIGLMVARCDGDKLGEIYFLQLSKQELVFGPMQIKARINQDQTIAKDLTLWNQQGTKVIRGQMQVLPLDKTFLYVEPIYLQAAQAPMPQLRKVALATGSRIAYADTYEEALAQLTGVSSSPSTPEPSSAVRDTSGASTAPTPEPISDRRLNDVRNHLRRYRELMSQGKFAEAGRELEAIDSLIK